MRIAPLSLLDDIDNCARRRLEEGITGVQALARLDLVDLIVSSRIRVPRLVDGLDQAILRAIGLTTSPWDAAPATGTGFRADMALHAPGADRRSDA